MSPSEVISALQGQTFRVPDLTRLFRHWPTPSRNEHYPQVSELVTSTLLKLSTTRPSAARHQTDGIALLVALWFPTATAEQLHAIALFTVWLVCWDDEVDQGVEGDVCDLAAASEWRAETLRMVRAARRGERPRGHELNGLFEEFVRRLYPDGEGVGRVCGEVENFITGTEMEQTQRSEDKMPTWERYMDMRMHTVAGTPLCAMVRTLMLPAHASVPNTAKLEENVCEMLSLLNDILSLKKELRAGCAINAVCVLVAWDGGRTLDSAADRGRGGRIRCCGVRVSGGIWT